MTVKGEHTTKTYATHETYVNNIMMAEAHGSEVEGVLGRYGERRLAEGWWWKIDGLFHFSLCSMRPKTFSQEKQPPPVVDVRANTVINRHDRSTANRYPRSDARLAARISVEQFQYQVVAG